MAQSLQFVVGQPKIVQLIKDPLEVGGVESKFYPGTIQFPYTVSEGGVEKTWWASKLSHKQLLGMKVQKGHQIKIEKPQEGAFQISMATGEPFADSTTPPTAPPPVAQNAPVQAPRNKDEIITRLAFAKSYIEAGKTFEESKVDRDKWYKWVKE